MVRRNNFAPSRRFREDVREASKLAKYSSRCRVVKQMKPGHPTRVQVEPTVLTP